MKIVCNYNLKKKYQGKPKFMPHWELTEAKEIEISELALALANGCNCKPSALNVYPYTIYDSHKGKEITKYDKYQFVSQQLFLIDIDNTDCNHKPLPKSKQLLPNEAIEKALKNGLNPSFIYETHSSSKNCIKYRIGFVLDRPIQILAQRNKLQRVFLECYDKEADKQCIDVNRGFYGGHSGKLLFADFKALNSTNELLTRKVCELPNMVKKSPRNGKKIKTANGNRINENIYYIQNRNSQALKKNLARKNRIVFDTRKEFFDYIYTEIDLAELLQVEEKELFKCIFHDDKEPSANVYRARFGTWQYHCFGCGKKMNTKQIIEELGKFDSEYQAIKFIKEAYNLEVKETEWAKEQSENIDRILDCLSRTDDKSFSMLCPTADFNTRFAKNIFIAMLIQAKNTIYPDRATSNGNILFYMSIKQITEASGKCVNSNKQLDKVRNYIKMLAIHGMIEIVPDEKVPKAFLQKALNDRSNPNGKHIQFYSIPSWVYSKLVQIEESGKVWKQNGITLKAINYESICRTYGYDKAKEVFPQVSKYIAKDGTVKARTTTKKQNIAHEEVQEVVCEMILDKGYCMEIEIESALSISGTAAKQRIKISLPDILACNNLIRIRCNKDIKAKYSIPDSIADRYHHPMIIIQG